MNTVWSSNIQKTDTLYFTRQLRFSDNFKEKYLPSFALEDKERILEIGCGPGALAQALHRWYPKAEIVGIDRDSHFIEFAAKKAPDIAFREGDATALSFPECSFDAAISNTVAEHIEPSKFFSEQYRVLKPDGVCLVLSARRGINIPAPCISEQSDFEKELWSRVEKRYDEINQTYSVCSYPMDESEYPLCMEKYGFRNVLLDYAVVNLTPDNPMFSKQTAHAMIEANRRTHLDSIEIMGHIAPDLIRNDELTELKRQANAKYDKRLALYDSGVKVWDTNVSITLILRGIK